MREYFGPGWRMYYVQRGAVVIVMPGGGGKSTQQADIAAAQALAVTIEGANLSVRRTAKSQRS